MIKFSGEMSKENMKFLKRKKIIRDFLSFFEAGIVAFVPLGFISSELVPFALCFGLILWPLAFLGHLITISDNRYIKMIPNRLAIDSKSKILWSENTSKIYKTEITRSFSDIKKIYNYEKFYYFIFYFPHKHIHFLCQKDLIVEGTLEEFEKLFEDKIIKKY